MHGNFHIQNSPHFMFKINNQGKIMGHLATAFAQNNHSTFTPTLAWQQPDQAAIKR